MPAELSILLGDKFELEEINKGLLLKPVTKDKEEKEKERIERQLKQLDKIAGSISTPGLEKMTTEELEEFLDGVYD